MNSFIEYSVISAAPLGFCGGRLAWAYSRPAELNRRFHAAVPTAAAAGWIGGGLLGTGVWALIDPRLRDVAYPATAFSILGLFVGWLFGKVKAPLITSRPPTSAEEDYCDPDDKQQ